MFSGLQEIVQPAKKAKLSPLPTPSSVTPALANGTTAAVPVSSSAADRVVMKPNDVQINRLSEQVATETSAQSSAVMKPRLIDTKASVDLLPKNSAVVTPALSHSAKVQFSVYCCRQL